MKINTLIGHLFIRSLYAPRGTALKRGNRGSIPGIRYENYRGAGFWDISWWFNKFSGPDLRLSIDWVPHNNVILNFDYKNY